MKIKPYHPVVIAVGLYLATVAQLSISPSISIFGAKPDLLLLAVGLFSMRSKALSGLVIGFFAGLLYGGAAGANLQTYIFSRMLAGLAVASLCSLDLDQSVFLAFLATIGATLVGQLSLILIVAPPNVTGHVGSTVLAAIYNGVLAIPIYAVAKRALPRAVQ